MRLRGLIFEDEALLRQLLWTILDRRGYEVFTYPDPGLCPLKSAAGCPCPVGTICADVIVSDVQMAGTTGLDFVQQLLEKNCRRPQIALMSGSWTDAEIKRAERLGCKVFQKPFHMAEMIAWLEQAEQNIPPERHLFDWQH